MRTRLFTLICALFIGSMSLHAQSSTTSKAIALNDFYAGITDSLYTMGMQWGTHFQQVYGGDRNFASLSTHRQNLLNFIVKKQKQVMVQKDYAGSENLRLAMMDFLSFEKSMLTEGFTPVEQLSAQSTEDEIAAVINQITLLADKESAVLEKVQKAQMEYAARNGFSIEKE